MPDKDREEEAEIDRDNGEGEGEGESSAEADRPRRPAEAGDDEAGDVEAASEGEGGEDGGDEDAAARVATALGVGDEEPADGAASEEGPKAPTNRAARRRDEALTRRRKKKPGAAAEELPADKNARAKELLARRKEQAAERRPVALLPGEMVEDAMSRMSSGAGHWIRQNFALLQVAVVVAIVGTAGTLFYLSRVDDKKATASSALAAAVAADRGKVLAEDKRSDDEKELDPTRVFKTAEERADTALGAYNKVIDEHGSDGAAAGTLAKLGQAGILLGKKDHAHALDAFNAVLSSRLAAADPDVKGRALEGAGFAKEGKGDLDGALASFKELEGIDAKGYKELGLYHQARILLAKGDTEKAKELLKSAREKLQAPSIDGRTFQFLEVVVDEALRRIDPTAVPARQALGGPKGQSMTQEELQELLRKARENADKKKAGDAHDDD